MEEDCGIFNGRTRNWPAIPADLSRKAMAFCSTSIVCEKCKSPYGGLIYDVSTDSFVHRQDKNCNSWYKKFYP